MFFIKNILCQVEVSYFSTFERVSKRLPAVKFTSCNVFDGRKYRAIISSASTLLFDAYFLMELHVVIPVLLTYGKFTNTFSFGVHCLNIAYLMIRISV